MGRRAEGFQNELLELGEEIARRRQAVGLTQPQLAERAGLSLDGVLRIEKGRTAASVVTLFQIAAALGCDVPGLFQKPARGKRKRSADDVLALLEGQPDEVVEAAVACARAVVKLRESCRR